MEVYVSVSDRAASDRDATSEDPAPIAQFAERAPEFSGEIAGHYNSI